MVSKKVAMAENKLCIEILNHLEKSDLTDVEIAYILNNIAHEWTQSLLRKKIK